MSAQRTDNVSDYSSVVRAMIDRENDLINHRITWLTTIQGLLFAALGFAWDKPTGAQLIRLLCLLGTAVSIIQLIALIWSTRAIGRLSDWWETNKPKGYKGPGVIGFPPSQHLRLPFLRYISRYLIFWNWIPVIFITVWGIVWYIIAG